MIKKYILSTISLLYTSALFGFIQTPYLQNSDEPFLFGAATAAIQVEGGCANSNWHRWIEECNAAFDPKAHKVPAGAACNFRNTYKDDIKNAAEIGLTAFRFSVEWSEIEPAPHTFNDDVISYYEDVCKTCRSYGITPLITLYHYTEPLWFWDVGSFEKKENIPYFVEFCTYVFKHLQKYNPIWLGFNTPSGIMGKRYISGARPCRIGELPQYKKNSDYLKARDFYLAGITLCNVLKAHAAFYKAIKLMPNGKESCILFLKNIQQHEPYHWWNPIDRIGATYANYMADNSIIRCLRTGQFTWIAPGVYINEYIEDMPYSFDAIGLNYYTHDYIKNFKPTHKEGEIQCQAEDKVIYPEGMYRALMTLHNDLIVPLKQTIGRHIPIYITENGIAARCDADRELFFKEYIHSIKRAMHEGVDIRGYIYWALMDNWSWGTYNRHYGLFHIDRNDPTLPRTLKTDAGTQYLIHCIKNFT